MPNPATPRSQGEVPPARGITHLDRERFTCGDCHFLAAAIHRLTGWPICAFVHTSGYSNGRADHHAFVRTPDGRYLDVNGIQDEGAMIRATEEYARVGPDCVIGETTWVRLLGDDWEREPAYGSTTIRRAEAVARLLISTVR